MKNLLTLSINIPVTDAENRRLLLSIPVMVVRDLTNKYTQDAQKQKT